MRSRERKRSPSQIAEVGFNNFDRIESWADIRIAISPHGAAEPGRTIEEIVRERRAIRSTRLRGVFNDGSLFCSCGDRAQGNSQNFAPLL